MTRSIVTEDPYRGLAASVVTSELIDLRDAFDFSLSWYTTAGSFSTFTVQMSNITHVADAWSSYTRVVPSVSSFLHPPLGLGWARIIRSTSGSSLQFITNKQIR